LELFFDISSMTMKNNTIKQKNSFANVIGCYSKDVENTEEEGKYVGTTVHSLQPASRQAGCCLSTEHTHR
jgi:hypothetical protein